MIRSNERHLSYLAESFSRPHQHLPILNSRYGPWSSERRFAGYDLEMQANVDAPFGQHPFIAFNLLISGITWIESILDRVSPDLRVPVLRLLHNVSRIRILQVC